MAHHNSTPQSVLDAPAPTVVNVSEQPGPNRASRRHWREPSNGAELGKQRRHKPMLENLSNKPVK